MDTLIKGAPAGDDLLGALDHQSLIIGAKQLHKALNRGGVRQVFLALDSDPSITEPLAQKCRNMGVPFFRVSRMLLLGKACGIDVGAAAAGVRV